MVCDVINPDLTTFIQYECENREGKLIVKVIVQQGTESPYYLGKKGCVRKTSMYSRVLLLFQHRKD